MHALVPRFQIGLMNGWLLCVPVLAVGVYFMVFRTEAARRMADMTGYTPREKLFTSAASLTPYPFMVLAVWAPFSQRKGLLIAGLALYSLGLVAYLAAAVAFARGKGGGMLASGVYRFSRNPIYVSAAFMFVGTSVATANLVLLGIQAPSLVLQHFMILAEERSCRERFGRSYDEYTRKVPRYLAGL